MQGDPVKLAGTTTIGADAAADLFHAHQLGEGGHLELPGLFVAEPDNPVDPHAVAVHVEGQRVGYLPGYLAAGLNLTWGDTLACRTQLWAGTDRGKLRVIGWAANGTGPVHWPHSITNPPAITTAEQRAEHAAQTTAMVDEALGGANPQRAEQFKRGMVGRYHYLETVEPIKQLKREGRLEEALQLCYGAIAAAERDSDGRESAPWYTEQAAIIHRKRGEQDQEIEVLERWVARCPPERRYGSRINDRLMKLREPQ